jgi:superfamily II DNA or RNA helicase
MTLPDGNEVDSLRARLTELEAERGTLIERLERLSGGQSLSLKGEGSDPLAGYGQIVVDECHHLSATSFESVARRSKAHYWLGLSATVARKDGHQPIIFMQCGPIRHGLTQDPRR